MLEGAAEVLAPSEGSAKVVSCLEVGLELVLIFHISLSSPPHCVDCLEGRRCCWASPGCHCHCRPQSCSLVRGNVSVMIAYQFLCHKYPVCLVFANNVCARALLWLGGSSNEDCLLFELGFCLARFVLVRFPHLDSSFRCAHTDGWTGILHNWSFQKQDHRS